MVRKPTPQERTFALGVAAGARRGRGLEREEAIRDVAAGLLAQDVTEVVRLVEKHGDGALPLISAAARELWPTRWRTALGPLVLRVMREAEIVTDRGPVTLGFDVKSPKLAQYFAGYMAELSGGVTETTREKVTDAIRVGLDDGEGIPEIASRVRLAGDEFTGYRSELIARDQTLKASRGASYMQAKESGVVNSKTRRSAGDSRVRPEHRAIDGETVPIDQPYSNGEMVSGDLSVQCRCTDIYEISLEALRGAT